LGKISEIINQMFQRSLESAEFTSAGGNNPEINRLIQINAIDNPDFESEIQKLINEQTTKESASVNESTKLSKDKTSKTVEETKGKVDEMLSGNLGDIKSMSTEQFGNVRSIATNPFSFITKTVLRKLKTGAGILFIIAIAVEVAKFLIEELFKPGRIFDMRFREQIDKQIIQFTNRREQEELRSGHRSLITTTIGGLRGDSLRGQIGGNFYSNPFGSGINNIYDPSYVRFPSRMIQDMRKKDFTQNGQGGARSNRGGNR